MREDTLTPSAEPELAKLLLMKLRQWLSSARGSLLRWTWADENGDGKEQMADGKEGEAGGRGRDGKERRGRILFCNPASLKRENLTVRVSYDEGATWAVSKAIYSGAAAYSCMAVLPDKSIGCLYENGEKQPYERISLARFGLDWLERKF